MAAKGTPATRALLAEGVTFTLHEYDHSSTSEGYGDHAAAALGIDSHRIFKTLIASVDGVLMVAVVPVAWQLDLKSLAAACLGKKAAMADLAAAERSTGYVRGGMSPLGQRHTLRTVVDNHALAYSTMFVSAGRRGLQIQLPPHDLIRLTGATTADIGRQD